MMFKSVLNLSSNILHGLFKPGSVSMPGLNNRRLPFKDNPTTYYFINKKSRINCPYDKHIEKLLTRIESLLSYYGVFHAKIHFSSGQVTLWFLDDPLRYRVYKIEDVINKDFFSQYTNIRYNDDAVDPRHIDAVLKKFKNLRLTDNDYYLRSGSINIINGMIGLSFSSDGSHYMSYIDFLSRSNVFINL